MARLSCRTAATTLVGVHLESMAIDLAVALARLLACLHVVIERVITWMLAIIAFAAAASSATRLRLVGSTEGSSASRLIVNWGGKVDFQ